MSNEIKGFWCYICENHLREDKYPEYLKDLRKCVNQMKDQIEEQENEDTNKQANA